MVDPAYLVGTMAMLSAASFILDDAYRKWRIRRKAGTKIS